MNTRILPVILLSLFSALVGEAAPLLDQWQWRSPLPQGNDLQALAYGNGRYVAVGAYGTILSSTNGADWTLYSVETNIAINGVAFGNGTFAAVGYRHPAQALYLAELDFVLTSTDGMNWTERPTGQTNHLWNVAYGNGLFVAVGSTWPFSWPYIDFMLTSPDGVTWTPRTPPTNIGLSKISFGGDRFVAIGNADVVQTSIDGLNWNWSEFGTGGLIQNVTFGAGLWIGVGFSAGGFSPTIIVSSPDAVNWTMRYTGGSEPGTYSPLTAVAYGNGYFVAMGTDYAVSEVNLTVFSADGLTWERAPDLPLMQRPTALLHANGQFVAVGEFGNIATSQDGRTWTGRSRATSSNLRGIAYGDGTFVAVGNNGTNLTSAGGTFWTGHKSGTDNNLREVTYAGGQFVAVGSGGTIVTSPNGADWLAPVSGTAEDLWGAAYGNGMFVCVGGNTSGDRHRFAIVTSSDGANWATRLSEPVLNRLSFELHAVTYGNGRFVAVGRPAAIFTSFNGINWTTNRNVPETFTYLKGVAYGNGLFVAVGETTNAWISPDGNSWTLQPLPVPLFTQLDDVAYGDGAFVAVGDDGIVVTSVNGVDWLAPHLRTTTNLRDVAFGAGSFVIVGNNDHILQSGTNATPPMFEIVTQPRNKLVRPGASVTFNVLAQGSGPLAYQWQRNGADIPGATGPSLAFNNVQFDDGGYFSAVVSDSTDKLTSDRAFLLVTPTDPLDIWSARPPGVGQGVAYGGNRFVSVAGSTAWTSTDGLAWTASSTPVGGLADVAYGNGQFVACGAGIAISTNGSNWISRPTGGPIILSGVTYGSGRFVAVGNGTNVTTSLDGVTWTPVPLPTNAMLLDVTYGNGQFVAVGESARVLVSPSGMNWTLRNTGPNLPLSGVAYGNGQFVTVGAQRLMLSSPDAVIWTVRTNPAPVGLQLAEVTFGHGIFLVMGADGSTYSSTDGMNWTRRPPALPSLFMGNVTAGPYGFVAVGTRILQSDPLVPAPPYVLSQPQSKVPLIGTSHTLNVGAVGSPTLHYRWRRNGAELPGATSSNYTIASVQLTNEGVYSVDVSNPFGSATSAPAEVIAGVPATFLQQPLSQDVPVHGSVTLSAVVTGRPEAFTYTWRYEASSLRFTDTSLDPMTFHTYLAPSIVATQLFRVVVSNAATIGSGAISDYAIVRVLADMDGDGLPDEWENAFGFLPNSAADGTEDFDHDGLSNAAEYIAGTNPTNATSVLRLEVAATVGAAARLRFTALANKTYTILATPALGESPWQRLADVAATASNGTVDIFDPFDTGNRFYRLVTPREP